jgi:hypothetical protein
MISFAPRFELHASRTHTKFRQNRNQTIKTAEKIKESNTTSIPLIPSHSKMESKQSKSRENPGKSGTLPPAECAVGPYLCKSLPRCRERGRAVAAQRGPCGTAYRTKAAQCVHPARDASCARLLDQPMRDLVREQRAPRSTAWTRARGTRAAGTAAERRSPGTADARCAPTESRERQRMCASQHAP